MGIVEESISFATNFLTQILVIIAGIAAGTKYVLAELRKSNERLGKKILGPDMDGRVGKGGLLDELRTELRQDIDNLRKEFKRENEELRSELVGMISDSHKELLNEFRRTSMKISYMSRDFSKMEKSLERMSGGNYTAAREQTDREDNNDFYYDLGNGHAMDDLDDNNNKRNDTFDINKYNKKRRGNKN